MPPFQPAYLALLESGELAQRVTQAYEQLKQCNLCAWKCRVNRRENRRGVCRTGENPLVSSYFAHMGEENCLRGWRGSGTIFFANCNMRCTFCQNYEISAEGRGTEVSPEALADMMLHLQAAGCHNINFVSPSHVVAPIIKAVWLAAQEGLRLPLVYNTGGYDSLEALALLDGVIDIYMPDMKFADTKIALQYSRIPDYPRHNRRAVREMHRQVGDLQLDPETGLAQRGLLVRHLILPGGLAGTRKTMQFLARKVSPETFVNLMGQYMPAYRAPGMDGPISRPVNRAEVLEALQLAQEAGLHRFDPSITLWVDRALR
ncbi:MAG: radical SAM protein [Anaerolineae bacterium]